MGVFGLFADGHLLIKSSLFEAHILRHPRGAELTVSGHWARAWAKRLFVFVAVVSVVMAPCLPAIAQVAGTSGPAVAPHAPSVLLSTPAGASNINLSSAAKGSANYGNQPVLIREGQILRTIAPGSSVTSAEDIAAAQVFSGRNQTLVLSGTGTATGGSLNLVRDVTGALANLLIPHGVTAVQDFAASRTLNVLGDLNNFGTLLAVSSASNTTASIVATNIFNQPGALISSIAPTAGLPGFPVLSPVVNLNLQASNSVVNAGTISSSGSLNVSGGQSITNASPSSPVISTGASTATMQAQSGLNLSALNIINGGNLIGNNAVTIATANLSNAGTIQSLLGDVTISNTLAPALGLSISATPTSSIQALNGSISVIDGAASLKAPTQIIGGRLLAQTINFANDCGALTVHLDDISGAVNVTAGSADLQVSNGSHGMDLNQFNVTGDPNLVYTGVGPFTSAGFNSQGGYVRIDTSSDTVNGSITFTGAINTTSPGSGNGGNVTLNAGTTISTQAITTSGTANGNGGSISLNSNGNITTGALTTDGGNTSGNAGSISVTAGYNSSPTTANINSISAKSSSSGNGGDIYVLAGQLVTIGNIDASAGSNAGTPGSLTLNNPYLGGAINIGNVNIKSNGVSNSFKGFSALSGSTITTGTLTVGGAINVVSLGNLSIQSINTTVTNSSGASVVLSSNGNISVSNGINVSGSGTGNSSGNIEVYAPLGSIGIGGQVLANGSNGASSGNVSAFAATTFTNSAGGAAISTSNLGTSGASGNISIFAGGTITLATLTASGGTSSGNGGTINVAAGTAGTGTLTATTVTATCNGSSTAGSLDFTAPGAITLGALTTKTASTTGVGGNIIVVGGTTGTSNAPAQTGTLTVGNIDTSSAGTVGGNVILVNMGAGGAVSTGSINLTASAAGNGSSGSLAIVAKGTITTNNITGTAQGTPGGVGAYASDIFLSTAATGTNVIKTGTISVDANGAAGKFGGNVYLIHPAGATVSTGAISQKGAPAGGTFSGTPTGIVSTISSNTTLKFSPGSVIGYSPGGFTAITGGAITVNATLANGSADPRLLAPLTVSGGNVTAAGITSETGTAPAIPVGINLIAAGNITLTGSAIANSLTGAGASIKIMSTTGSISTSTVNASGTTPGSVLLYGARGVNVASGGSILANSLGNAAAGGNITMVSPNGDTDLGTSGNQTGNLINAAGSTGGNIFCLSGANFNDYEVSLQAQGTTGAGGNITIQTLNGAVALFELYGTGVSSFANIDVSSTGSLGGNIYIAGPQAVNVLQDSSASGTGTNSSVFNANGFRSGGTVVVSSSQWAIGLAGLGSITAVPSSSATAGTGGSVSIITAGEVVSCSINVSGQNGGTILESGFGMATIGATSLSANGSAGAGGRIRLLFPFEIDLGYSGIASGSTIYANGTTFGGQIDLQSQGNINLYDTVITATATGSGTGGVINLASYSGNVSLYQGSSPSSLDTSSVSGTGGLVHVIAGLNVASLPDPSGGSSFGYIAADGGIGGAVIVASTNGGGISLSNLTDISANGSSGAGGLVSVAAFNGGTLVVGNTLSANGTSAGGSVAVVSAATLSVGAVYAQASSGNGGSIYLSSVGNLIAGALVASGTGGNGGVIYVTTAQPDPTATGTTLSQSGAATTPFASGTISVASLSVTGSSAGSAFMYTSGGATITGGAGATTSTTKTVLPAVLSLTAAYTLTPDVIPGGGFSSLSNTSTLTLSAFPLTAGVPLYDGPGTATLGTISAASEAVLVVAGGAISYTSISTNPLLFGNGGNIGLYTVSAAANSIVANGNATSTGGLFGTIAGTIVLDAPFGSFSASNTASFLASANFLAAADTVSIFADGNISLPGGNNGAFNGTAERLVSFDGNVSALVQSVTGTLSGSANSAFTVQFTQSSLTVSNISARAGTVTLQGTGAAPTSITVAAGADIFANQGNLVIENDNAASGTIGIGANANLAALSSSTLGNVSITIGPPPAAPTNTTAPANVAVSLANGGLVYFGKNNISASAPSNTINASGSEVVFNTGTRAATAITLGGGDIITADPPAEGLSGGSSLMVFSGGVFFDGNAQTPNASPINTAPIPNGPAGGGAGILSLGLGGVSKQLVFADIPAFTQGRFGGFVFQPVQQFNQGALVPTDVTPILNANGEPGLIGITEWKQDEEEAEGIILNDSQNGTGTSGSTSPSHAGDDDVLRRKKLEHRLFESEGTTAGPYLPIAFPHATSVAVPQCVSQCKEMADGLLWQRSGSSVRDDGGVLEVKSGGVIFWSQRSTSIKTPLVTVETKAGTLVSVEADERGVTVRNLYEPWSNSVELKGTQRNVMVSAGSEVTILSRDKCSGRAESDAIGRRCKSTTEIGSQLQAQLCEISLASLLAHDPLFALCVTDPKAHLDQKVLKLIAALWMSTGSHGAYSSER